MIEHPALSARCRAWRWLFPKYDRDWPSTCPPEIMRLPASANVVHATTFVETQRRILNKVLDDQVLLDAKRDRLITLALMGCTLLASTVNATHLTLLAIVPAMLSWLLAACYLIWVRNPTDRPLEPGARGFCATMPDTLSDLDFQGWILDGLIRATESAQAFSCCLSRHVLVGSVPLLLGLGWLCLWLLLALLGIVSSGATG